MARLHHSSLVRTATIEQLETRTNLSGTPVMLATVDMLGTVVNATDPRTEVVADVDSRLDDLLQEAQKLSDAKKLEEIASRLPSRERFAAIATPPPAEWLADRTWSK